MLQRFRWDDDRARWPSLEPGARYPLRRGGYCLLILARIEEGDGRCRYCVNDPHDGTYEQNDFAVLNKVDYTAGVLEETRSVLEQQMPLVLVPGC